MEGTKPKTMTAQQEAQRLRKEFGDKAVKVVDEILKSDLRDDWIKIKSELEKLAK